jgi:sirohydrochlorin cobaltochelatase
MKEKKAVLVVSFGTSYRETREKTIEAIEEDIRKALPEYEFRRAFTSPTIRRILKNRDGIEVDDVVGALEKLSAEGYRSVILQPTHVIRGFEYDAVTETATAFRNRFDQLRCGDALLTSEEDFQDTAQAVIQELEAYRSDDTAFLLMGHGTEHAADASYQKLQQVFQNLGRPDILIGTVEAPGQLDELIDTIRKRGAAKVVLSPLMVVAGDHALNDMAGESPDSWRSRLKQAGFSVTCRLHGLGENASIRSIYIKHCLINRKPFDRNSII